MRRKHRNGIFTAIGCKDQTARFRYERPCHCLKSRYRFNVSILGDVDNVNCIVAGMRNVKTVGRRVNVGMVETTRATAFRQVDVTQ
jgi:hypothetical protein